jgi:acyl-coenzyme A synthetase/AMP-(fatty) acid ligase
VNLPPAAVKMLFDADLPPEDLSSLRMIMAGTSPLDPDLAEAFEARYGIPVLTNYGATELGFLAGWSLSDHRKHRAEKRGSAGRVNAGVELRVVDESGAVLPPRQVGLLEVKAPRLEGGRSWVRTTDLARLDEDGFLWIVGRDDGAIIRGGFKLLPPEIEKALESHPAVREAAVVGLPDERLGQVPVAAIVLEPDAEPVDEQSLRSFARENLTGYQVPTRVIFVEALPRTPSMKVSQPGVRELFGVTN